MSLFRFVSRPVDLKTAVQAATTRYAASINDFETRSSQWCADREHTKPSSKIEYMDVERRVPKKTTWEDTFITSLVQAGTCRDCARRQSDSNVPRTRSNALRRERSRLGPRRTARGLTTIARRESNEATATRTDEQDLLPFEPMSATIIKPVRQSRGPHLSFSLEESRERVDEIHKQPDPPDDIISRDEYSDLVNTYGPSEDESLNPRPPTTEIPIKRQYYPLSPRLAYTVEQEERLEPRKPVPPEDDAHAIAIHRFKQSLARPFGRISLDQLWANYVSLRTPRLRYLTNSSVRKFLRHLAWVEIKDGVSGERFISILEECLGEQIAIHIGHWNTAISFVGKATREASSDQVRHAVEMWMRMEDHGIQADNVTFNILFDVAIKAGRFSLADQIYRELLNRNLPLNRFLRTSVIYYAGLRRDGEAVRQAFQELVNAGEIVDTAVMNAVIQALVRAGEAAAAEQVFLKMKRLSDEKFKRPIARDWQERKAMTVELTKMGENLRRQNTEHASTFFGSRASADAVREKLQGLSPIAPDAWTYGHLITWQCETSGNFSTVQALVREMRDRELIVNNAVYLAIFRGFAKFGGHGGTDWTRRALDSYWDEFLAARENVTPDASSATNSPALFASLDDEKVHRVEEPSENNDFAQSTFLPIITTSASDGPESSNVVDHGVSDGANDEANADGGLDMTSEYYSREQTAPHFTSSLSVAVIRAFWTCAGRAKMEEIWTEIRRLWSDMTPEEAADLQMMVNRFVKRDSIFH